MRLRCLLFAALIAIAGTAFAASERVALVIGNNAYASAPLRNAVNDAQDLAKVLGELGFHVILRQDATRKDMVDAVRDFGAALEGANVGLFFYAGHAMQFKDRNYLIPVDIVMASEDDVTFYAIEVQQVFDRLERARTRQNLIILDACRDNPFASSFRVSNSGLAQMSAPPGTLIAYATAPGSLAQDGSGRNGVYTRNILEQLRTPDVPVELMFKRVREGVERETQGRQIPWDSSSLRGNFAFNPSPERSPVVGATPATGPSADATLAVEREFWASARESNRAEDIRAYLERYPHGQFEPLARSRLDALAHAAEPRAAPPASGAPPPPAVRVADAAPSRPPPADPVAANPVERAAQKPATRTPTAPPRPAAEAPPTVAMAPPSAATLPGRELSPGVREVTFPDGAIYRGGVQGARMHGKGEYIAKSFRYSGEFRDGVKEGQGTYVWDNGNRYEGPFAHDQPNGFGKYTFANGDVYTGEMRDGALTGRGSYATRGGDVLEGTFANGVQEGVGTLRLASGDRYEGEIRDGKADGKGTYYFANGDRYEGDIRRSALTGRGTYFHKSGEKYVGQMLDGRPNGEGQFWFPDGSHFDGRFEDGLAHATGVMVKDGESRPAEMIDRQVRLVP
ncbi:MAG TPA: caspase family protein [Usitatibacter sp.]|nr:caspase family protein [Usitatibacter sp.]